ncbi:MAG: hypothetical protein FWD88_07785, partial [Treponema sp.]|nr:hypothetical protein [Treponema sp.]
MVRWIVVPVTSGMTDAAFLANPPPGTVLYNLNRHRRNPSRANLDFFYNIAETDYSGWVHLHDLQPDPANQTHNFKFATNAFDDESELWLYVIAMDGVYNLGFAMQRIRVYQEGDRPQITTPGLFPTNASGTVITGPGDLVVDIEDPSGMPTGGNWAGGTPRRNTLGRDQGIDIVFTDDDGIRLYAVGDDQDLFITITIYDLSTDPASGLYGTLNAGELRTMLEVGTTHGYQAQWAGTLTQGIMAAALNREITDPTLEHDGRLRDGMYRITINVVDYDGAKVYIPGVGFGGLGFNYNSVTYHFAVHSGPPQITLDAGIENRLMGVTPEAIGGYIYTPFALQRLWIHFNPDVITPAEGPGRYVEILARQPTSTDTFFERVEQYDAVNSADVYRLDGLYRYRWDMAGIIFGDFPGRLDGADLTPASDFWQETRHFTLHAFDELGFRGIAAYHVQVDNTPPDVALRGINQGRPFTAIPDPAIPGHNVIRTHVWGNVGVDISATDNHGMYGVRWWLVPGGTATPEWDTPFQSFQGVQIGDQFADAQAGVFREAFDSRLLVDGNTYWIYVIARDQAENETVRRLAEIVVDQDADAPELDEIILNLRNNMVVRQPGTVLTPMPLLITGVARDSDRFDPDPDSDRLLGLNAGDTGYDAAIHRGYVQMRFDTGSGVFGPWLNVPGRVTAAGDELNFNFNVIEGLGGNPADGRIRYQVRVWDEEDNKNPQWDLCDGSCTGPCRFCAMDDMPAIARYFPGQSTTEPGDNRYFSFILDRSPPLIGFTTPITGTPTFQEADDLIDFMRGYVTERNLAQFTVVFDGQSVNLLNNLGPRASQYEWCVTRTVTGYSLFSMGLALPFPNPNSDLLRYATSYLRSVAVIPGTWNNVPPLGDALTPVPPVLPAAQLLVTIGARDRDGLSINGQSREIRVSDIPGASAGLA